MKSLGSLKSVKPQGLNLPSLNQNFKSIGQPQISKPPMVGNPMPSRPGVGGLGRLQRMKVMGSMR